MTISGRLNPPILSSRPGPTTPVTLCRGSRLGRFLLLLLLHLSQLGILVIQTTPSTIRTRASRTRGRLTRGRLTRGRLTRTRGAHGLLYACP